MSHPSQLATFSPTPPPPIFTHSMVTTGDGLLQPVTCMGLVATSSAGASVPGPVPLAPQQQQQLTAANGGNGSIVGMGMSLYGSDVVSVSLMYFPNSWTLLLLLVDSEPVVKATLSPNVQNVESINMQSGFSGKDFWQRFRQRAQGQRKGEAAAGNIYLDPPPPALRGHLLCPILFSFFPYKWWPLGRKMGFCGWTDNCSSDCRHRKGIQM